MASESDPDELLPESPSLALANWTELRRQIIERHQNSSSFDERGALLGVYASLMSLVERSGVIAPSDLAEFRDAREKERNLMLIAEASISGSIDPALFDEIVKREINAGRMEEDHDY